MKKIIRFIILFLIVFLGNLFFSLIDCIAYGYNDGSILSRMLDIHYLLILIVSFAVTIVIYLALQFIIYKHNKKKNEKK